MTTKSMPGRIPSEELGEVKSWMLPPVDDTGRILSSAEKEARMRREKLLQQGKEKIETVEIPPQQKTGMTAQEMQDIFDAAEKDGFAQGHAAGFEQGKNEGYEAGRQQGLMEMRAHLTLEQQRFQHLANSLLNPLTAQDNDIEHMLLDVICSLTQSVIQRELVTDSSHILELVKTAVEALPVGSKNIRISLNPEDLAVVETYASEQQLDWKFFADTQLQPGGCKVETPESRVDFSVSQRLQTVLEQFLTGQLAQVDAEESSPSVE
ncbi:flagellar assembly protein FliH [Cellvibrio sp.]|uniref:flagellar assembly protein FliH n=1 Tax=Cellvibrio sp. TaxID=1965322 RepID=UPI00396480E9